MSCWVGLGGRGRWIVCEHCFQKKKKMHEYNLYFKFLNINERIQHQVIIMVPGV